MIRVAVSGIDEATCREVARRIHRAVIVPCEGSHADAGPTTACDAIALFGPLPPTTEEIERQLNSGRNVLLAADPRPLFPEWGQLADCASRARVQWSVVNPDHALPSRQLIRQQLDSGKLGRVGLIRSHRWEPDGAKGASLPESLPGPLFGDLEVALWLTGTSPNVVYAIEPTETAPSTQPGSLVQVHLGFADGGMALVTYSNRLPPGDGYRSLTVIGSSGAAYADDQQDRQLLFAGGPAQAVRTGAESAWVTLLQEFVDALVAKRDLSFGRSAWTRAGKVAEAVRKSLALRRAVAVEAD